MTRDIFLCTVAFVLGVVKTAFSKLNDCKVVSGEAFVLWKDDFGSKSVPGKQLALTQALGLIIDIEKSLKTEEPEDEDEDDLDDDEEYGTGRY